MQLTRKKVSPAFRQQVLDTYPVLKTNVAYRRMVEYLLFGTFIDKDTKRLIISQEIVAQIEGKQINGWYSADEFLQAFKRDVLHEFDYITWGVTKARQVLATGLSPELEALRIREMFTQHNDYVYFVNGDKRSRAKITTEREKLRMNALDNISKTETEDARLLLDYMNNLPPHKFSKTVNKHINDAYATAIKLNAKQSTIQQQVALLRTIEDVVQPFYKSSEEQRTVRIFSMNESMLMLKKEVRRALTREWNELDLKSAHLAIFAYMFDIAEVNEFLASGEDIWMSLFEHFNLPYEATIKGFFKEAMYSVVYGMPVSNIKGKLTTQLNKIRVFGAGDTFVSHPIIAALLKARDQAMADIKSNGGAVTIYGKAISTDDYDVESILSQLAQAVELKLLMPALHIALENKEDVTITLWQHDGFSVDVRNNKEYWIKRMQRAVKSEADKLGINTYLEVSV